MKITILIEDATEEEARRLLQGQKQDINTLKIDTCGIKWSDAEKDAIEPAKDWYEAVVLYKVAFPQSHRNRDGIRKKFWEMHRKKPIPDPLPGQTGCEGCELAESGSINLDDCDKCSPPPAPIAKKLKEKFNPTASEKKPPAKKKTSQKSKAKRDACVKNAEAPRWSDEEKEVVDKAADADSAWTAYKEKFPGERNENAIYQRWLRHHDEAPLEKKAPAPLTESGWTPEEDMALKDCPTEDRALMHFMEKFPDSLKTAKEVSARWAVVAGGAA